MDEDKDIKAVLGLDEEGRSVFRPTRLLIWMVAAIVIGVGVYAFFFSSKAGDGKHYVTEPVSRGALTVIVTATGTVEPTNEVEISSELSGTIRNVLVDHNSQVTKGQELAQLDTDKLKAEVARARATLLAREAKVKEAEATVAEKERAYERVKRLASRQVSSEQDLDTAKAAYDRAIAALASAKADVSVAQAELRVKETDLAKACICSPIRGIVLKRNVEPGQYVATSLQAPVLFTLAEDLRKMELEVDIDEADVGKVREGQKASFTVDAYPGRKFPAEIIQLRFAPETVEGVVTYKAVLRIDNSELLLRPGMTATAEITVQTVEDALMIPNAALRFSPPSDSEQKSGRSLFRSLLPGPPRFRKASKHEAPSQADQKVWVLREGKPVAVPVIIGPSDGTRTQLVKGELKAGDEVIVDMTASK